jgi:hypothetical protein
MTLTDMNSIVGNIVDGAKENMQRDGYVSPVVFFVTGKDHRLIITPLGEHFSSETEKDGAVKAIKDAARSFKADLVMFVAESWVSTGKEVDGQVKSMSEKKEAIVLSYEAKMPNGEKVSGIKAFMFDRDANGGVVFTNTMDSRLEDDADCGGRFSDLLPE